MVIPERCAWEGSLPGKLTAYCRKRCRYIILILLALVVDLGSGNGRSVVYPWVSVFEGGRGC